MDRSSTSRARKHIEEIRKQKFCIGQKERNPLTQDLHHAVVSLSAELYTKDVHFLMELIQNAEDNEYQPGVEPTLEFVLTDKDITDSGAPATLLVFNNEVGFTEANMNSICSIGMSTKKGKKSQGYIGEKGIGFKSVFLVSKLPHIFSNGYQVRFSEELNQECGIGFIVPEWVEKCPTMLDIQTVYGSDKFLQSTTIILPLRPEKVDTVKKLLSDVHPEILLFLTKIKGLSVREVTSSCSDPDPASAISISSETNISGADDNIECSRVVHLSVEEGAPEVSEATCRYYIYRKLFPVKPENIVEERKSIEKWDISIAFPFGERLKRGTSSVGIFAFLPTAMVTNFNFIVQADFILASSREAILLDNKWNLGILSCVPSAFVSAFSSYVKSVTPSSSSFAQAYKFLPVELSAVPQLNDVRQTIKKLLQEEDIVRCASFYGNHKVFCRASNTIRISPDFRKLLCKIEEGGIPMDSLSSLGKYVVHSNLDCTTYSSVLDFLGVTQDQEYSWFLKFIQATKLLSRASINIHVELLCFLAHNWIYLPSASFNSLPLIKCVTSNGGIISWSIADVKKRNLRIYCLWDTTQHIWLNKWNREMKCQSNVYFLSDPVVILLLKHKDVYALRTWLTNNAGVKIASAYEYCVLCSNLSREKKDRKLVILLAHLVYHAHLKKFIGADDVSRICRSMPIVDALGHVNVAWTHILLPSSCSKWIKLFRSHYLFYWTKYVALGNVYAESAQFAGEVTPEKELLSFLLKHTGAVDLPDILPPNVALEAASSELTSDQAFLLLDWIKSLRTKGFVIPEKFIESVRNGKWMKTYAGINAPTQCFLLSDTAKTAELKIMDLSSILSVVDQEFYKNKISKYKDELTYIGVRVSWKDVYICIVDRLISFASSLVGKECLLLLLKFMKCSKLRHKLDESLLKTVKEGKWMRTNKGYVTPVGSVFVDMGLASVSQITCLPVIDQAYYGNWMGSYVAELELLGVVANLEDVCKLFVENFKLPDDSSTLSSENMLFILRCIKRMGSAAAGLTHRIRDIPLMRTTSGLRCPTGTILLNREWLHVLPVGPVPLVDEDFYGNEIQSFTDELKMIGVSVDLDMAAQIISVEYKSVVLSPEMNKANVIRLLKCLKYANQKACVLSGELQRLLSKEKWLKTCLGWEYSWNSVLPDSEWKAISPLAEIPLIDLAFYGNEIYDYRDELKYMGVIVHVSDGAHLIANGLDLPEGPVALKADISLLLLRCIRYLSEDSRMLQKLIDKLKKSKWLKTSMGYRLPEVCIRFDPDWKCFLHSEDAPFVDENFYGNLDFLGKAPLKAIGVKVDVEEVCVQLSTSLVSHKFTSTITRIYRFLNNFKWCPEVQDKSKRWLWIPSQIDNPFASQLHVLEKCSGIWVEPKTCVLHNKDNLFASQLHILEKYYDNELLLFFSSAFGVLEDPAVENYINLWKHWESGKTKLTSTDCISFWTFMINNWCLDFEEILQSSITKLPAITHYGTDILLVDKEDVFIPDDLQLKKLFTQGSDKPLFVWPSQSCSPSLPQRELFKIYSSLGVRNISESVSSSAQCLPSNLEKVDPLNGLIGKGLIKIILSFLRVHCIDIPMKDRHNTVSALLEISVYESEEPIVVNYSLLLPSTKRRLDVESNKMVIWEKNCHRLLVHKMQPEDRKGNVNFVISFARAISEGLLPQESVDVISNLCKIIELGFVFGFTEDSVDSLLTAENLELSVEDVRFLDAKFPNVEASKKRHLPWHPVTPLKKHRL